MLRAYKYSDAIQDALESAEMYVAHEEDMSDDMGIPLNVDREALEEHVRSKFEEADLAYRVIRRKKTTSFAIQLPNDAGELEDVKVTLRYTEAGKYVECKYVNVTFERDLDFYVAQAKEKEKG